jgi:hypothetical protein
VRLPLPSSIAALACKTALCRVRADGSGGIAAQRNGGENHRRNIEIAWRHQRWRRHVAAISNHGSASAAAWRHHQIMGNSNEKKIIKKIVKVTKKSMKIMAWVPA